MTGHVTLTYFGYTGLTLGEFPDLIEPEVKISFWKSYKQ